jgi:hypothetical protein
MISPCPGCAIAQRALGQLADAGTEITEAVRGYIAAQCNASRAAAELYTHRNTLLRRLARADQLLPRPLAENVLNVGVALEMLRWQGGGLNRDNGRSKRLRASGRMGRRAGRRRRREAG